MIAIAVVVRLISWKTWCAEGTYGYQERADLREESESCRWYGCSGCRCDNEGILGTRESRTEFRKGLVVEFDLQSPMLTCPEALLFYLTPIVRGIDAPWVNNK
tara:strand:+ start:60 stop:368 length:309 start_codon:yes stop_codon:yes gene_type:complete